MELWFHLIIPVTAAVLWVLPKLNTFKHSLKTYDFLWLLFYYFARMTGINMVLVFSFLTCTACAFSCLFLVLYPVESVLHVYGGLRCISLQFSLFPPVPLQPWEYGNNQYTCTLNYLMKAIALECWIPNVCIILFSCNITFWDNSSHCIRIARKSYLFTFWKSDIDSV